MSDKKSADSNGDVALPKLTAEQEKALREKFLREQSEQEAKAAADGEWVVTNTRDFIAIIPDLGITTGNTFSAEKLQPFETKDLGKIYKPRELRASRHLAKRFENGDFVRGRAAVGERKLDPLAEMALVRPQGSFTDPLSGKRPYDIKLQRVIEDERRANDAAR